MLDGSYTYIQLCNLSQVLIYMYLPFATDPSTSTPMHLKAWFGFVAWSCKSCKSSSIFLDSKWVPHAKLPLTTLHPSTSSTIPVIRHPQCLWPAMGLGGPRCVSFFFSESSAASELLTHALRRWMNPPNFLWWCWRIRDFPVLYHDSQCSNYGWVFWRSQHKQQQVLAASAGRWNLKHSQRVLANSPQPHWQVWHAISFYDILKK